MSLKQEHGSQDRSRAEIHRRALSAAAGVVGRPRVQAGALALGLALVGGCVVIDKGGDDESVGDATAEATEATGDDASSTLADASSSATGDTDEWTTDMSSGTGSGSDSSSGSGDTTAGTTGTTGTTDATTGDTDGTTSSSTTADTGTDTDANPCMLPDGTVDWVCCEQNNWMPFPQCTPWGPPAPPAFHRPRQGALV